MKSASSGRSAASRRVVRSLSLHALRFPLLALLLLGSAAAYAVEPDVSISSPGDGSTFPIGDDISFTAAATDAEDDDATLTAAIGWSSSLDGSIGAGGSFSTGSLSAGTHTITASVTDSEALSASDSITITVTNDLPTVSITSPSNGESFALGEDISFSGTADDTEDGSIDGLLAWSSSLDGNIGSGSSFSTSSLTAGNHTITASVTDSDGNNGSNAISITITNNAPSVTINSPSNGASFALGDDISFDGSANDAEDGDIADQLSWSSSIDGNIGSGDSFSTSALSAGSHTITASVSDSNGNDGSAAIGITVTNNAPDLNITSPGDGSSFAIGDTVDFSATASDAEDGDIAGNIAWTSSLDGSIGSGASFSTSSLSAGNHTITASVNDSDSNSDSESISITVTDNAPVVNITAPGNNSSFALGANISFGATANDAEDGDLADDIDWSSSLDGGIGSGGSINTNGLTAGTHTITASVTDDDGNSASSSITVTVTNGQPTVTITQPGNGANFAAGESIGFQGNASDDEDGSLTASIAWTSNLDGNIGSGGSFSRSDLSIGSHTITASVTDSNDNTGTASITVTVTNNAPAVDITSPGNNADFSAGTPVNFAATATDTEDGNIAGDLSWNSSLDGNIGSGASFSRDDLSVGTHTITASVTDSDGGAGSDSVTISVTNSAPTADSQNVSTNEDTAVQITLTGSDAEGDNLTFQIASQPSNGTLSGTAPNVTYTPNADYNGSDSFTFTVNDGQFTSGAATVSITVNPVNDAPTADNQTVTTDEDTAVNITLVADDIDNDSLTFSIGQPSNGSVSGSGPDVTYTPNDNFSGADSFTFSVNDGSTDSNTATVTVNVSSVADAPEAFDDTVPAIDEGGSIQGTFNVLDNDDNPETVPMTADIVTPPAHASSFTLNTDGTFNYTHNGSETTSDSFTYQANNGDVSNTATVSLTINPVNDAPTFVGLVSPLSTLEDSSLTIVIGDLIVDDAEGDPVGDLQFQAGMNYTVAGDGSTITPDPNFNGQLSIGATVSDGVDRSDVFFIDVDVESVNDLPVLEAPIGSQTFVEDAAVTLDVSGNFSDGDGETLTYRAVFDPVPPPARNIGFNQATGVFTGPPRFQPADPADPVYQVTVTAIDPNGAEVSDVFDLTISQLGRANVGLEISVSPESALPNEQLQWTFTSNNPVGPVAGENVELNGAFVGNGLSVGVEGGANCSINTLAGSVEFSCTVGMLPVGQTSAVTLTTTASEATEVVAFATAEGAQREPIDPNPADNSAVRAVGVASSFSAGAVQQLGSSTALSIDAGDVNGDGVLDLVVGTISGQPVQIFLGAPVRESCDCQRDFQATPISIPDTGANEGVALGDFNNNNTLDLVVANGGGQPDTVWLNDGAGNFTQSATLEPSNGRDVAVGDFNNDGNLDFAVAANSPNPVYFGNGNGGFSAPTLIGDQISLGVAAGRLNNDNRDDLVFANVGAPSEVWTKNANGNGFTRRAQIALGDAAAVAVGDFSGDNIDDVVLGRVPTDVDDVPSNPVLINSGNGSLGAAREQLGFSPTNDVIVGDVNADGSLDLLFVSASGVHQIWTAAGNRFQLHGEQIIDIGSTAGVLAPLGDTDTGTPGGIDLAVGGDLSAGVGVYLNDSLGNLGRGDIVAPVITLTGETTVSVPSGAPYTDAGATATDNIDGDITPVATNNVNTAVVGTYTVTYNATDFAGNAADPVSRTVNVTPATGRGGGGGGALGMWVLLVLAAAHLLFLAHKRMARQRKAIKI